MRVLHTAAAVVVVVLLANDRCTVPHDSNRPEAPGGPGPQVGPPPCVAAQAHADPNRTTVTPAPEPADPHPGETGDSVRYVVRFSTAWCGRRFMTVTYQVLDQRFGPFEVGPAPNSDGGVWSKTVAVDRPGPVSLSVRPHPDEDPEGFVQCLIEQLSQRPLDYAHRQSGGVECRGVVRG